MATIDKLNMARDHADRRSLIAITNQSEISTRTIPPAIPFPVIHD
jgi:hypothetical protein